MFQNMLMTALTPLSATNEINCWDNRPFINQWPELHENRTKKCEEITRTIKKKPKRARTCFTTDQLNSLENEFSRHQYIDARTRSELSKSTKIGERQIKIWFQNRRMKKKRQSSESSSDFDASSISSTVVTSSIDGEGSLVPQQSFMGTYAGQAPMYNIEVTYPVIDEQYEYQLQQFPTYQNIQYQDEMGVYPTEYYPTSYENNGHEFPGNVYDQNYVAPAAEWYDVNQFPNHEFLCQQNV